MRRVLVTGGTRGIGRAVAEAFLQRGDRVLFLYRKSEEQAEELRQLGAVGYRCDLSDLSALKETCKRILAEEGSVQVLVNNAGIAQFSLLHEVTDEMWEAVRSVNYDAPFYLTRAFLPGMIRQKYGRILNISSMWGQVGASCEVAYSAAKAGVIGFTKALAKEVGPSGITVNCIAPGVVDTEMNAGLSGDTRKELKEETPLGRLGTPLDVAKACIFLSSEDGAFITGQVLGVNGGLVIV
ncbi:MAG: 3-oxoacyl-ACP reductase FabG [Clostridiales bacterium]|nr:3-oxoacyl-ACP reductase FabG [Clostridiales bacterium]HCH67759.1 3-oxoacyl-ACP reductase [Clostridiales bacterium]